MIYFSLKYNFRKMIPGKFPLFLSFTPAGMFLATPHL